MNLQTALDRLPGPKRRLLPAPPKTESWALAEQAVDHVLAVEDCKILQHGMDKVDVLAGKVILGIELDEGDVTIIGSVRLDTTDGRQWLTDATFNLHRRNSNPKASPAGVG